MRFIDPDPHLDLSDFDSDSDAIEDKRALGRLADRSLPCVSARSLARSPPHSLPFLSSSQLRPPSRQPSCLEYSHMLTRPRISLDVSCLRFGKSSMRQPDGQEFDEMLMRAEGREIIPDDPDR